MAIAIPITGLYPTIANLELDEDAIKPIIQGVLSFYGKYHPRENRSTLSLPSDIVHYTYGLIKGEKVPKFISEATLLSKSDSFAATIILKRDDPIPDELPWRYVKPTLYVPVAGDYSVLGCYDRTITNDEVDVDEGEELFFNLLAARIMIATGRTRRSIVFNNAEFALDYSDMVNDGTQKEQEIKQEIIDNCNFGLAWG